MVMLSRTNTKRLLKQVQHKPHARAEDHDDRQPLSPPPSNPTKLEAEDEDYDREPESSSDEAPPALHSMGASYRGNHADLSAYQIEGEADKQASYSSPPASEKRKTVSEAGTMNNDDAIFAETDLRAKRRKVEAHSVKNIHTQPRSKHDQANAALKHATYGSRSRQLVNHQKKALEKPRQVKSLKSPPKKATFRMPKEISATKSSDIPRPHFRATRSLTAATSFHDLEADSAPSSSLSSVPNSPDLEDVQVSERSNPQIYSIDIECAMCGSKTTRMLRETFEDTYNQGRSLNYKWQQRFCRYHKQHESREVWKQRGYPEIDWDKLGTRLRTRAYTKHLKKVLIGETASIYRDQLAERLESGIMSVQQSVAGEGKAGANVGYYGPRGEKLLTEYIVSEFASEIRDQSTKDPLVAAAGVQGGVSGFVQAVLVPELAMCLIKDDLGSNGTQGAAEVIAASGDLGDMLNPEVEDDVQEVDADDR